LYTWTADQVDPRHRFDEWRSVRSKGLFGVTAELEPEQQAHFKGKFTLQKIGNAGLIELRASPYSVTRSARRRRRAKRQPLHLSAIERRRLFRDARRRLQLHHALFEESAMSFSQTVTAMRIDESPKLLAQVPLRPIAKIAVACGFESLATFYRVFRAAHGVAPGDFREAASRDA